MLAELLYACIQLPQSLLLHINDDVACRYMNSEDYEGGFDEPDIEAMLSRISSDFRGWAEDFVPLAIGGSADDHPSAVEVLARSFFAMDPRVAHGLARMIFLGDQRELLGDVAVPSTLVHVSGDFAAPPCVGRYMQARMRAAAMYTIDSVGHFPQLVTPGELLGILDIVLGSAAASEEEEEVEETTAAAMAEASSEVVVVSSGGLAGAPESKGRIDVAA
jgi:pimeloyl-ACP methyl ester carboxylesterase